MNIFWLDTDLTKCAQAHCDKHVVKMILESCQLLATAHHLCGSTATYKPTHKNHPCAIWVRESYANYILLRNLARALCWEYEQRFNKEHKCFAYVKAPDMLTDVSGGELFYAPAEIPNVFEDLLTVPPLAIPDDIKNEFPEPRTWDDVVEAYRIYYNVYKREIAKWNHSPKPDWMF